MEFMGKRIMWSPLTNGYVGPGSNSFSGSAALVRVAAQVEDINIAVYNLYDGPNEVEVIVHSTGSTEGGDK